MQELGLGWRWQYCVFRKLGTSLSGRIAQHQSPTDETVARWIHFLGLDKDTVSDF
jgi:hypothetical protein